MRFWREIAGLKQRLAANQADRISDAIVASIDVDVVVGAWMQAHSAGGTATTREGRDWARTNIITDNKALEKAVRKLWATGYLLGNDVALSAVAKQTLGKAPTVDDLRVALSIDWSNWKPGNKPAALLLQPPRGLADLLAKARVVIKGISDTTLDRIGTMLSLGLNEGAPAKLVADTINKVLQDPRRSMVIARTEMNRAMSVASTDTYREAEVEYVTWLVTEPCDVCAENENVDVVLGEEFPSGDTEPPAHPNCVCAIAPVIAGLELAVKGVPSSLEQKRAHSRLAILPNPNIPDLNNPDLWVQSPWQVVPMPTVDPNQLDNAVLQVVRIGDLFATDPYLNRKRVGEHIDVMGQAMTDHRSHALVAETGNGLVIVDGHHRLMAWWLLGQETAPVFVIPTGK